MQETIDVIVVEDNVTVQFLDNNTSVDVEFVENVLQITQEVIQVVVDPGVIDVTLSTQQGPAGPPGPQGPPGTGGGVGEKFTESFVTSIDGQTTFTITTLNFIPESIDLYYNGVWQPTGYTIVGTTLTVEHTLPALCFVDIKGLVQQ